MVPKKVQIKSVFALEIFEMHFNTVYVEPCGIPFGSITLGIANVIIARWYIWW